MLRITAVTRPASTKRPTAYLYSIQNEVDTGFAHLDVRNLALYALGTLEGVHHHRRGAPASREKIRGVLRARLRERDGLVPRLACTHPIEIAAARCHKGCS